MKKLLLITLILVLAACSGVQTETPIPSSTQRQTWVNANIAHYRFDLILSCFCAFRDQMPLSIEVKDGAVVSMTGTDGKAITSDDPNYQFFLQYATIDNLFTKIDTAKADPEAGDVTVTYDPTYGYPLEASIDYIELAADDEMYVTVSGFEALA
jgi:hypothetical protein